MLSNCCAQSCAQLITATFFLMWRWSELGCPGHFFCFCYFLSHYENRDRGRHTQKEDNIKCINVRSHLYNMYILSPSLCFKWVIIPEPICLYFRKKEKEKNHNVWDDFVSIFHISIWQGFVYWLKPFIITFKGRYTYNQKTEYLSKQYK